jgi:hypothetical protein
VSSATEAQQQQQAAAAAAAPASEGGAAPSAGRPAWMEAFKKAAAATASAPTAATNPTDPTTTAAASPRPFMPTNMPRLSKGAFALSISPPSLLSISPLSRSVSSLSLTLHLPQPALRCC